MYASPLASLANSPASRLGNTVAVCRKAYVHPDVLALLLGERDALDSEVLAPVRKAAAVRQRSPRAAPGSKGKAAFTLRLDAERHLKLRLACAIDGRSAQMLVTEALDALLGAMPELAGMAERAPKKKAV